ncbi:MAG: Lrp/AsnC family transcriptional regulator [Pseudomonadota bacterium]
MNNLPYFEKSTLDAIDAQLVAALAEDGRVTTAALARRVGLSPPSVAERIRRLEDCGVIQGYGAKILPAALGRPLSAWIRIRPMPGQLKKTAEVLSQQGAIVACDRVTGEDCFIARAHVASVQELETLIDSIIPYAMTNSAVVQSSPVAPRLPPLPTQGLRASRSRQGKAPAGARNHE